MSRADQIERLRLEREHILEELELLYKKAFERIISLDIGEGAVARLTQALLNSKEAALIPLSKEIEKPLITKPPKKQ